MWLQWGKGRGISRLVRRLCTNVVGENAGSKAGGQVQLVRSGQTGAIRNVEPEASAIGSDVGYRREGGGEKEIGERKNTNVTV